MLVTCPAHLIEATLNHLREAGERRCECVVLWLARRGAEAMRVEDAYRPAQTARADMFQIPAPSMNALYGEIRERRLMVAAQVHSHPKEAFHSKADDRWAIIRHEGALSLVVPDFAANTTTAHFLKTIKVYQFSADAKWCEVPATEVSTQWLKII